MFFNINIFDISVFGAKLQIYFDMCKFFCTFVPFFSKKTKKMAKLLIIDDERGIRNTLREILADEGYEVEVAENGKQGLEMAQAKAYDLIFSDIKMPEMDGMEVLAALKNADEPADCPIVMITGHGDVETAVQALKAGAYDFLVKPLDLNRILITTKNALESKNLRQETKQLRKKVAAKGATMVGESAAIQRVREIIDKVAPTEARVLITGPNGTGKEVVAHLIHENSARANGPMVEVNCAAIPSELIESGLFGHEKGSFTSAIKQHKGKFEQADGGTLFLDEVGDMSLSAQAKVLRVLQENKLTRVGSDKDINVNVRVIAATNKNIPEEIEKGNFREDLYHRLSVIVIRVPALSERKEDIPLLTEYFIDQISKESGMGPRAINKDALEELKKHSWTGNIRELRNVVERLMILGGNPITKADVVAFASPMFR